MATMKRRKRPDDDKLPVTAELGGEGGSYGDATMQAETFKGEAGNPRVDRGRVAPAGGESAAAAEEGESVRPDTGDSIKHATEPPDRPSR